MQRTHLFIEVTSGDFPTSFPHSNGLEFPKAQPSSALCLLDWLELLHRRRRHRHHQMNKFLVASYTSLIFELRSTQVAGKFYSLIQMTLSVLGEIFLCAEVYAADFARSEWFLSGMDT